MTFSKSVFLRGCAMTAAAAALTFTAAAEAPAMTGLNLNAAVAAPLSGLTYADTAYSSSTASDIVAADESATAGAAFVAPDPQYQRRVYGRPRYQDHWHNADGSTKLAFEAGGGFTVPAGSTGHYQTPSWKFSVGGGRNFNKHFGVLIQFDYDKLGIPSSTLNTLAAGYQSAGIDTTGLDGSTHIWSFTVDPIYNLITGPRYGMYVTGGGGYYRKTTNFTLPQEGEYCYYYCYTYESNQTFDSYTSGGFGANGGVGFTYKVSRFSNAKLFAEARYTWIDFSPNYSLYYPPNSFRTGYFPVTVGVRW